MKSENKYSTFDELHLSPQDTLYPQQWHFDLIASIGLPKNGGTDIGIQAVWQDYRGQGVKVGIWDDGVQNIHPDLAPNYNSQLHVSVGGMLNNGQPLTSYDGHGTSVAGLIGAVANSDGVIGVAYESQLTGVRIFGGSDDINSNWDRYLRTLDHLSQFDVTNHSYGGSPDFTLNNDVAKFKVASENGRNGLGTINIKSAGNSNIDGNGDALDATRHTITVAATDNKGQITYYSTYGAHILVSAPAASVTTDLIGPGNGYDGLADNNYTNDFGGTSAAGPVTAGVVALMLSANDQLGWRDVQNILAYSASGTGSLYTGVTSYQNASWKWNDAENWNGGGLHFSEDYGYGLVNAFSAVRMSEVWSILYDSSPLTSANEMMVTTGDISVNKQIRDLKSLTYTFNVTQDINLEHVDLKVNLTHSYLNDLRIRLISPGGSSFTLYDGSSGNGNSADFGLNYAFGVDGLRGESSQGTWTLIVQDAARRDSGVLKSINFTGYGSPNSDNNVYHYTEEILDVVSLIGQSDRLFLSDMDEGIDWINAAAFFNDLDISLESGATSTVADQVFLTIANDGTVIENVTSGDGNDEIIGNTADNLIYGGRGNDVMEGGNGIDTAIFRGQYSEYTIQLINGLTQVTGLDGTDQLSGFELLQFDDITINDPSEGTSPPDTNAPVLQFSTPADNTLSVAVDTNIALTFNENITLGAGNIKLISSTGDTTIIQANDISQVNANGKIVTINPSSDLDHSNTYYLQVEENAILDASGNDFIVSDTTTLNFTTENSVNIISGTNSSNTLNGTVVNDAIFGLGGNDTLNGLLGNDLLDGGSGRDNFVFSTTLSAENIDILSNFNSRDDTIRLENAIFSSLNKTGSLSAANFVSNVGGVAQDSNDYILYDTSSGSLYYDSDGNGAGLAIMFAEIDLNNLIGNLTRSDFVVI